MKFLIIALLMFQTGPGPKTQTGGPGRYYDSKGASQGQVTKSGTLYSQKGSYSGRQDYRSMYNSSGTRTGSVTTHGGTTRFYGPSGKYEGSAVTSGGTTRFYDSKGASSGTANKSYGTTTFRGPTGKYEGVKRK